MHSSFYINRISPLTFFSQGVWGGGLGAEVGLSSIIFVNRNCFKYLNFSVDVEEPGQTLCSVALKSFVFFFLWDEGINGPIITQTSL